jgi:hypothetical protein
MSDLAHSEHIGKIYTLVILHLHFKPTQNTNSCQLFLNRFSYKMFTEFPGTFLLSILIFEHQEAEGQISQLEKGTFLNI